VTAPPLPLLKDLEEIENFETIQNLITQSEKTKVTSRHGNLAKDLISDLYSSLTLDQKSQLIIVLLQLLEIEYKTKETQDGEWKLRGMYAFLVYITILDIPLEKVNFETVGLLGEYLQLLDDYEDIKTDKSMQNFFKIYPKFNITEHYIRKVKPVISSIFIFDFNSKYFCEFIDTYHIFQIRSFKIYYEQQSRFYNMKRLVFKYVLQKCNSNLPFFH
jgi:hypothetical protein